MLAVILYIPGMGQRSADHSALDEFRQVTVMPSWHDRRVSIIAARRLNHARRQQHLRLARAGEAALAAILLAVLGAWAASARLELPAMGLRIAAGGLGMNARRWLALARRSRVGAQSEEAVQRALAPLEAEGWRLRHSLPWRGRGDIDSVAIAPTGIALAIETKTRSYDGSHLARVRQQALWLSRRRRRWARSGALAVLCLVRPQGVERVEHDVLVVSIDRLTHVLRVAAGTGSGAVQAVDGGSRRAKLLCCALPW